MENNNWCILAVIILILLLRKDKKQTKSEKPTQQATDNMPIVRGGFPTDQIRRI